ncbi:hypothetical protein P389DRAFT_165360 [Cystobasidium minutum MCA 4210]|uniref:uncharacterized protein n=1 Tax=Cystobasidium minutum MCA 4210 TaxID=1397322 RepID=UPI0034CD125D|eukprot:jgi/Rhomi1/165360/fgenesh1_kg.1_\
MATTITSRTATVAATSSHKQYGHHPSSKEGGNHDYDLKACLEILKRLAPKVSPDLPPPLPSTSTASNNNVTVNNTSSEGKVKRKKGSEEEEENSTAIKRSRTARRSSSPEDIKKSSTTVTSSKKASSSLSKRPSPDVETKSAPNKAAATTTSTHKRSGSTVSLSDLKARNKAKTNGDEYDSSSSAIVRKVRPSNANGSTSKHGQAADLSISTNHKQASISPTLPSPAPTLLSRSQQQPQQPLNAPSPESIALNGNNSHSKWTRERFKRIAAVCREKGRALKHSGDKRMREYSSPSTAASSGSNAAGQPVNRHIIPILALFEQVDAVILYAYAFWCEDQAAGCVRGRAQTTGSNGSNGTGNGAPSASTPNLLSNSTNSESSSGSSATLGGSTSSLSNDLSATAAAAAVAAGGGSHSASSSSSSVNASSSQYTWKSGCIAENWKSIFGLVGFVRGRAEKMMSAPLHPSLVHPSRGGSRRMEGLHRAMEIIVAWLNMLEALILQHLTTNSSRQLNSQASRLLSSNNLTSTCSNSSATGLSPAEGVGGGTGATPNGGGDNESIISNTSSSNNASNPETNNFLQSFLKLQSDLEKIHTLWPASQDILLHPEQSALPSSLGGRARLDSNDHRGGSDLHAQSSLSSRQEEDILSLVLRKGRMAYDYEPTKLDDIVMPNLPKDGDEDEEEFHGGENDDSMDAEGEVDPTVPQPSTSTASTVNQSQMRKSRNSASSSNNGGAGPKSPEDLFKDEENYFRFSWPIIIHHRNAIAHTTSFGRALVFEMANRLGVDYTPPDIMPSRRT